MSAGVYSRLDGVDNYEEAHYEEYEHKPHKYEDDQILQFLELLRGLYVATDADLRLGVAHLGANGLLYLIPDIVNGRVRLVLQGEGCAVGVILRVDIADQMTVLILRPALFLLLQGSFLRQVHHVVGVYAVYCAYLIVQGVTLLRVLADDVIHEYDYLIDSIQAVHILIDINDQGSEGTDDHKTGQQYQDAGGGHYAVFPHTLYGLGYKIGDTIPAHCQTYLLPYRLLSYRRGW